MGVDPHADAAGGDDQLDLARAWGEAGFRIFRIDPAFDHMAGELDVLLTQRQLFARRDPDLLFDDVDAGQLFGDRMLDLNPGVHFHEIEIAVGGQQEFDRPGIVVAGGLGRLDRGRAHAFAQFRIQRRRRRLFEQFLVAALNAAIAFPEVDDIAVVVGQDLEFDVARIDDIFFHVKRSVAEGLLRLGPCRMEALNQTRVIVRDAHSAAAAAGRCLDDYRIAQRPRHFDRIGLADDQAFAAGRRRHSGLLHGGARHRLVAQSPHRLGRGADEGDVVLAAGFGEIGVFGQEPVPRVNRVDIADGGHAQYPVDQEVTRIGSGRPDADGLVGFAYRQAVGVGQGIDRHGFDAQLAAGADHAQRDFTAVGDQNFVEKCHRKIPGVGLFDHKKRLAEFDRAAVFHQDVLDDAGFFGLDFIHDFHGFDDAHYRVRRDFVADLDERRRFRRAGAINRSDQRRIDGDALFGRLRRRRHRSRRSGRGRGCGCRRDRSRRRHYGFGTAFDLKDEAFAFEFQLGQFIGRHDFRNRFDFFDFHHDSFKSCGYALKNPLG
ncbi:hypothetical protein SDC9_84976 [bioreactor metagenome]|uniref:Uncharacterized protein n=1 Tax=bioreactor metagenome TaxID=1076179 RepID=A0A644ZCE4_9ZZZZ